MSEILLIDAEQPFAQQLVDALKGTGFSVTQLEDGKEGLEYARNNKPALIVLCVELPKMSGYSICNKLKKDAELKTIPLVITSSEATPETFAQHKKLKTRAEDYLIKPFEPPELLEKIGNLIEMPSGPPAAAPEDELASFEAIDELGSDDLLDGGEVELGDQDLSELAVESDDDPLAALGEGLDDSSNDNLLGDDGLGDDGLGDDGLGSLGDDDDPLAGFGDDDDALAASASSADDNDDGLDGLLDDDDLSLGDASDDNDAQADGDLDLGAAVEDKALDDFDDAFENMAPLGEAPAEESAAPPPPPDGDSIAASSADFAQISALRRENADLKARVSELESRLKGAEEAAEASKNALSQTKSSSTSSARDVLNLKEQLMAKDKELLALKDEVFEKEKATVEVQEEIETLRNDLDQKAAAISDKEAELASTKTRLDAVSQERDDLEKQVNEHLGKAQQEAEKLREEVESKDAALAAIKAELESKADEIAGAKKTAEEAEDRLVAAYKRLEAEEAVRAKAKEATQIALALLSGDVDPGGETANGTPAASADA